MNAHVHVMQVLIRGRHVFMGYLGRPESTQEVFTSDGFLRSGDVGYVSKVREWERERGRMSERERE